MSIFIKRVAHTFAFSLIGFFLGLGISVIITRGLGPEGKGVYALAMLLYTLLITATNFGIGSAITYYTGKREYPLKEIFGSNIISVFGISVFAIMVGIVMIMFFNDKLFGGIKREYLFLVLSFIPLTYFLDYISLILLGLGKIPIYNMLRILRSVFFFLIITVIFFGSFVTLKITLLSDISAATLSAIILFFVVKRQVGGISLKLNMQYIKKVFSFGAKAYLAYIFWFLHWRAHLFLINAFLNPASVGFYVTALALSEGVHWFPNSTAMVLFPKVASERDEKRKKEFTPLVCRNVLFIASVIVLFLFLFAKWIVTLLYSDIFLESVLPFRILLIGTVAFSGWSILNTELLARGKPMLTTLIIIPALLNILLNIIWIPRFGIVGASIALTISYIIMFIITLFVYKYLSQNRIRDVIFIKRSDLAYYKNLLPLLVTIFSPKSKTA